MEAGKKGFQAARTAHEKIQSMNKLKEGSSDWTMVSRGNRYAGCLRKRQGLILQGLVDSLGTLNFMLCLKEAIIDFNQKRDIIQLFL